MQRGQYEAESTNDTKRKGCLFPQRLLDLCPQVPRVSAVKELSAEHRKEYNNWKAAIYRSDPKCRKQQSEYKKKRFKNAKYQKKECDRINNYRKSEEGVIIFYINSIRHNAA